MFRPWPKARWLLEDFLVLRVRPGPRRGSRLTLVSVTGSGSDGGSSVARLCIRALERLVNLPCFWRSSSSALDNGGERAETCGPLQIRLDFQNGNSGFIARVFANCQLIFTSA